MASRSSLHALSAIALLGLALYCLQAPAPGSASANSIPADPGSVTPSGLVPGAVVPLAPDPAIEGQGMSRSAIFARIDSLEQVYEDEQHPQRAMAAYRMGQLYLATDLRKHKRRALDLLEQAQEYDPELFDAGRLRARTAQDMRYTGAARKWIREMTQSYTGDSRAYRLLGQFYFVEARRKLEGEQFEGAVNAFSQAVAIDSTDVMSRLGLASALVAIGGYPVVPEVVSPMIGDPPYTKAALLLGGAAYTAIDDEDESWDWFQRALELEDEATRATFLDGREFFEKNEQMKEYASNLDESLLTAAMAGQEEDWDPDDGFDMKVALRDSLVWREASAAYWRARNPRPSHVSNLNQLRYWQRLVEADVMFGDPRTGVRGWETHLGQAWVRWGRPSATRYMAAGFGSRLDELQAYNLIPYGGRAQTIPDSTLPILVWAYDIGHYRFALMFEDVSMNARWTPTNLTSLRMYDASKRAEPMLFPERLDETPTFGLDLSTAAFYRPEQRATLEGYLGIEPMAGFAEGDVDAKYADEPGALVQVEWAIFDASERRVEFRKRLLDASSELSTIMELVGGEATGTEYDPLVVSWAADLVPGRYRVAVDVTDVHTGFHASREIDLEIPPRAPRVLSMSDLEVATTFHPYDGVTPVPGEFIKHAYGVVPAAGGIFAADANVLYVYYEVYNLELDAGMQTRFNVTYDVYKRSDRDKEDVLTTYRRDGMSRIDPLSMTYVEETTGASPQRHVVKGGMVDISGLGAGRYILVVGVMDLNGGGTVESFVPFTKAAR